MRPKENLKQKSSCTAQQQHDSLAWAAVAHTDIHMYTHADRQAGRQRQTDNRQRHGHRQPASRPGRQADRQTPVRTTYPSIHPYSQSSIQYIHSCMHTCIWQVPGCNACMHGNHVFASFFVHLPTLKCAVLFVLAESMIPCSVDFPSCRWPCAEILSNWALHS